MTRHRHEHGLEEGRFRAMFDITDQLQMLLSREGLVLEANRAVTVVTGQSAEQLRLVAFYALPGWPADERSRVLMQARVERTACGESNRFELVLWAESERPVHVEFTLKPMPDDSGQVTQLHVDGRDVTERRRTEASLREISALSTMGLLAARVAHEINNPLAGIQNAFLLVRDAIPSDHPHHRFVGAIEREIVRIAAVTRQLYETYRPDQALATSTSVLVAVNDAVVFLEQVNRARQVRLETNVTAAPSTVPVPDALFRQTLYNLVQNAIDATPNGSSVRLIVAREEDWCVIRVLDEGAGIPADVRERIFDPFFSSKDRSVKTGGMGLGLSLVSQSVTAVGGDIAVSSRPSGGTEFRVRVPMTPIDVGVLR
jgi:two-component system sporulation sensor kinase C